MRQHSREEILRAVRNNDSIADVFRRLEKHYIDVFSNMSDSLLNPVMDAVVRETQTNIQNSIPAEAGIVIGELTPAAQGVINDVFNVNREAMRTLPQKYLGSVRSTVVDYVSGRGTETTLKDLTSKIKQINESTDEEAHRASMDLVRSAYQGVAIERARSVGSTVGIWVHTYGHGKYPRINHEHADGHEFDLTTGEFLSGPFKGTGCGYGSKDNKMVLPGQPRYCHCTFRLKIDFGVE